MRRIATALACFTLLALMTASGERAAADEPYPSKPIRFVLPQPAGGAVDLIARALGDRLSYAMRQPVIVENQPGANGGLAAGQVARAAPDGYTLFMAVDTNLVVNPNLYPNLPYHPFRDFIPISIIAKVYLVLVASSKIEATSVQELLAFARAHPGKLNYASIGLGTQAHLGMELLKMMTKTVPGNRAGDDRHRRGRGRRHVHGPALGYGARGRRQGQDIGDRVAFALEPDAAGSDHAGSRRAGIRAQRMVRIAGAGQDAAACRRPARQRGQDGGRRFRIQEPPGRAGFGRVRKLVRGDAGGDDGGHQEMERGHRRGRRPGPPMIPRRSPPGSGWARVHTRSSSMAEGITGWRLHVGVIFPTPVPPRAVPEGVDMTTVSLTIQQLSDDDMDQAIKGMERAAKQLASFDVDLIYQS